MANPETIRAVMNVLSLLEKDERPMPLESIMQELTRVIGSDDDHRTERPMIVVFANVTAQQLNIDCHGSHHGGSEPPSMPAAET